MRARIVPIGLNAYSRVVVFLRLRGPPIMPTMPDQFVVVMTPTFGGERTHVLGPYPWRVVRMEK